MSKYKVIEEVPYEAGEGDDYHVEKVA